MKNFQNIQNDSYTFGTCEICDAQCCDGNRGSTFSQLILEDFPIVAKNFPILFLIGELGYLKPVVLLSNGKSHCPYITDMKCTIYHERPPVCKLYPLSPHLTNETYIDLNCPAVNQPDMQNANHIIKNGVVQKDFFHTNLIDYQGKYINTHNHLEQFNKKENLEIALTINNDTFYKFKSDFNDKYLKLHIQSLSFLTDYYLK